MPTPAEKSSIANLKLPPHSLEAEQSVLGGLMMNNAAWEKVEEILVADDFYRRDHRLIFIAMIELSTNSSPLDAITVSEHLDRHGHSEDTGGLDYLAELVKNTPSVANIQAYAEAIRERALIRQLIATANDIADAGFNPEGRKSTELIDYAETSIFRIAEQRSSDGKGPRSLQTGLLAETLTRIEEMSEAKGGITGLATGFTEFDKRTTGLQPADLVIIAGRPSMGKTTFAMNIAEHAALAQDKPVLIFSMEMPADALLMRSMSSLGRVDQSRIRSGTMQDQDWNQLVSAFNLLKERGSMYIDDTPNMSPAEVRTRARRVARENGGISLIVIDYLQLMSVPGKGDNRTLEVSEISRSLKALAKELRVPVIALSQLNRSLEQRADRRPVMADLRESGAIEQDADLIAFIYRDEVYNEETEHKGMAEIIISKQRNGPIGKFLLTFQGKFTRFDNYAHPDSDDYH